VFAPKIVTPTAGSSHGKAKLSRARRARGLVHDAFEPGPAVGNEAMLRQIGHRPSGRPENGSATGLSPKTVSAGDPALGLIAGEVRAAGGRSGFLSWQAARRSIQQRAPDWNRASVSTFLTFESMQTKTRRVRPRMQARWPTQSVRTLYSGVGATIRLPARERCCSRTNWPMPCSRAVSRASSPFRGTLCGRARPWRNARRNEAPRWRSPASRPASFPDESRRWRARTHPIPPRI
jgi:hypothetical protein